MTNNILLTTPAALALAADRQVGQTLAPDRVAGPLDMARAAVFVDGAGLRDGGALMTAITAALISGIGTAEWAEASRMLDQGGLWRAIYSGGRASLPQHVVRVAGPNVVTVQSR